MSRPGFFSDGNERGDHTELAKISGFACWSHEWSGVPIQGREKKEHAGSGAVSRAPPFDRRVGPMGGRNVSVSRDKTGQGRRRGECMASKLRPSAKECIRIRKRIATAIKGFRRHSACAGRERLVPSLNFNSESYTQCPRDRPLLTQPRQRGIAFRDRNSWQPWKGQHRVAQLLGSFASATLSCRVVANGR